MVTSPRGHSMLLFLTLYGLYNPNSHVHSGTSWWWGKGQEKYSQQHWPLGSTGNGSKELSSIQFPWLAGGSGGGGWVHSCGAVVHVAGQDEGHLCNLRRQQRNEGMELALA